MKFTISGHLPLQILHIKFGKDWPNIFEGEDVNWRQTLQTDDCEGQSIARGHLSDSGDLKILKAILIKKIMRSNTWLVKEEAVSHTSLRTKPFFSKRIRYMYNNGPCCSLDKKVHGPHCSPEKPVQINKHLHVWLYHISKRKKDPLFPLWELFMALHLKKLNPHHLRMFCSKFIWNWPSVGEILK